MLGAWIGPTSSHGTPANFFSCASKWFISSVFVASSEVLPFTRLSWILFRTDTAFSFLPFSCENNIKNGVIAPVILINFQTVDIKISLQDFFLTQSRPGTPLNINFKTQGYVKALHIFSVLLISPLLSIDKFWFYWVFFPSILWLFNVKFFSLRYLDSIFQ